MSVEADGSCAVSAEADSRLGQRLRLCANVRSWEARLENVKVKRFVALLESGGNCKRHTVVRDQAHLCQ